MLMFCHFLTVSLLVAVNVSLLALAVVAAAVGALDDAGRAMGLLGTGGRVSKLKGKFNVKWALIQVTTPKIMKIL